MTGSDYTEKVLQQKPCVRTQLLVAALDARLAGLLDAASPGLGEEGFPPAHRRLLVALGRCLLHRVGLLPVQAM